MKKISWSGIRRIRAYVVGHPLISHWINWAKTHSLPGFFKVPIFDVVVFVLQELKRYDLMTRANAIAFSFFLSLFPALIALFTMLPWLKRYLLTYLPGNQDFNAVLQQEISQLMPGVAGERLFQFVFDITNNPRFGLLSFGFILTLYFSSNGMLALMRGFEKSYEGTFKKMHFVEKRLIATMLTMQLGFLLISAVAFIILGQWLIAYLSSIWGMDTLSRVLLGGTRWLVILVLFYLVISLIYRYGAPVREKFRIFTPGATLATFLGILSSLVFSYYVDVTQTYNKLYGTIGTIIVLMLWIQINAFVLLIGFELNASIAVNRDLKKQRDKDYRENLLS